MQTLVDFLDGFYRQLHLTKATLVGNSLGGWVAAAFAIARPEKVERLGLVDSAGYWTGVPLTREWVAALNPPAIRAPTLVVWGREDRLLPPSQVPLNAVLLSFLTPKTPWPQGPTMRPSSSEVGNETVLCRPYLFPSAVASAKTPRPDS